MSFCSQVIATQRSSISKMSWGGRNNTDFNKFVSL